MNLKQAAGRLGVHYQTAYKWVRSGALAAVRVGGRYEVSDAAIERFRARREAVTVEPEVAADTAVIEEVRAEVPLSRTARARAVARALATTVGDAVVVRLRDDGDAVARPVAWSNPDPGLEALISVFYERGRDVAVAARQADDVMRRGETVLVPIVDQVVARRGMPREYLHWLDRAGCYSLIIVPVRRDGEVVGTIWLSRDRPGSPYTARDVDVAEAEARQLGEELASAALIERAWAAREEINTAVEEALTAADDPLDQIRAELADHAELGMVVDPAGLRVVASTPRVQAAVPELMGANVLDAVCADRRAEVAALLDRLVAGELDYADGRTALATPGGSRPVTLHAAVARRADDSPGLLTVVVTARPPGGVRATGAAPGKLDDAA